MTAYYYMYKYSHKSREAHISIVHCWKGAQQRLIRIMIDIYILTILLTLTAPLYGLCAVRVIA